MKNKNIILVCIVCVVLLGIASVIIFNNKKDSKKVEQPIFIGKILEIEKTENNTRLLVQGYIRGCEVYEETLVAIIGEETEILSNCNGKTIKEFSVNDKVYIELSEAMTKSLPPQSFANKIQVTKMK